MTQVRNYIMASFIALASLSSVGTGRAAIGNAIKVPPVPSELQVPDGNTVFLVGHATGTQNYICLPSVSGAAWTFFAPQATLFANIRWIQGDVQQQIITHFLSPNPFEGGKGRATWQSSFDTSTVWGSVSHSSTDPDFVAAGAIPWLLLQKVGAKRGPTGGEVLAQTTYIQRLNTSGGVAPPTGCSQSTDVGNTALVPYTADYFFYKADKAN